jgi:hypothetical protein
MAGDTTYKYITTTGRPPLDGRPPNLVQETQEHRQRENPRMSTRGSGSCRSANNPSRNNTCHRRPPTPYYPVEPPPPYRTAPGTPDEQQWVQEHHCEGSYFQESYQRSPGLENDHPTHHCSRTCNNAAQPYFHGHRHQAPSHNCGPESSPAPIPARSLPIGGMIPGTRSPLIIPFNPSGDNDPRELCNAGYLFQRDHTVIHLIEPEHAPFLPGRSGENGIFNFEKYLAPTSMTIAELMDQIMPSSDIRRQQQQHPHHPQPGNYKERGIVECIERPEGGWKRGQEFWIGGSRGNDTAMKLKVRDWKLADIGWDASRGGKEPVWIARTAV